MRHNKEQVEQMVTKDDVKRMLRVCIDPGTGRTDCYEQCKYFDNICCQDFLCKDALAVIEAQEQEIERLKTTLGQCNTELNSALESLKSQCREIGELKEKKKQVKIDVLNKVMNYINNKIENEYGDMSDSVNYLTIDISEFDDFIDELLVEVRDDNSRV